MALSPGTPNSTVALPRAAPRPVPGSSTRIQNRPAVDRQGSIAGSSAALPKSPAPEIDPATIRTYPSVAADDALRSIIESEGGTRRVAANRAEVSPDRVPGRGEETLVLARRQSKPYDPKPIRRPILDILA